MCGILKEWMFHLLRDSGVALHWITIFSVGVIFHIKRLRIASYRVVQRESVNYNLSLTDLTISKNQTHLDPNCYSRSWMCWWTLWQKPHHHNCQTNWIIKGHRPIRVVIWTLYFYFCSISIYQYISTHFLFLVEMNSTLFLFY